MLKSVDQNLPVVAIVGRPNIGKSSLFNVIIRKRVSIVHEQSGVTRDRVAYATSYNNRPFLLVDTGGLGIDVKQKKADFFDLQIREQLLFSLEEADVIIMMADLTAGLTESDRMIAKLLYKQNKKVILACNKADNEQLSESVTSFYSLGFKDIFAISCLHKKNIRDLLEVVVDSFNEQDTKEDFFKIAMVGRPNVGKSSLCNSLLGEDRLIVSTTAGTTRDAVDVNFVYKNEDEEDLYGTFIDTAGIKRRSKVDNLVEMFSMMRTQEAIDRADLVFFILDLHDKVTFNDKKIANLIMSCNKPCLIIANKWDLLKGTITKQEVHDLLKSQLPFMHYAPLIFVSALENTYLDLIMNEALVIREQMKLSLSTSLINYVLQDMLQRNPPSAKGTGVFKIYYATLTHNPPATFLLFCNKKKLLTKNYAAFIEKTLRKAFNLIGIPIVLHLKERRHLQDNYRETSMPKDIKEKLSKERQNLRRKNKRYR